MKATPSAFLLLLAPSMFAAYKWAANDTYSWDVKAQKQVVLNFSLILEEGESLRHAAWFKTAEDGALITMATAVGKWKHFAPGQLYKDRVHTSRNGTIGELLLYNVQLNDTGNYSFKASIRKNKTDHSIEHYGFLKVQDHRETSTTHRMTQVTSTVMPKQNRTLELNCRLTGEEQEEKTERNKQGSPYLCHLHSTKDATVAGDTRFGIEAIYQCRVGAGDHVNLTCMGEGLTKVNLTCFHDNHSANLLVCSDRDVSNFSTQNCGDVFLCQVRNEDRGKEDVEQANRTTEYTEKESLPYLRTPDDTWPTVGAALLIVASISLLLCLAIQARRYLCQRNAYEDDVTEDGDDVTSVGTDENFSGQSSETMQLSGGSGYENPSPRGVPPTPSRCLARPGPSGRNMAQPRACRMFPLLQSSDESGGLSVHRATRAEYLDPIHDATQRAASGNNPGLSLLNSADSDELSGQGATWNDYLLAIHDVTQLSANSSIPGLSRDPLSSDDSVELGNDLSSLKVTQDDYLTAIHETTLLGARGNHAAVSRTLPPRSEDRHQASEALLQRTTLPLPAAVSRPLPPPPLDPKSKKARYLPDRWGMSTLVDKEWIEEKEKKIGLERSEEPVGVEWRRFLDVLSEEPDLTYQDSEGSDRHSEVFQGEEYDADIDHSSSSSSSLLSDSCGGPPSLTYHDTDSEAKQVMTPLLGRNRELRSHGMSHSLKVSQVKIEEVMYSSTSALNFLASRSASVERKVKLECSLPYRPEQQQLEWSASDQDHHTYANIERKKEQSASGGDQHIYVNTAAPIIRKPVSELKPKIPPRCPIKQPLPARHPLPSSPPAGVSASTDAADAPPSYPAPPPPPPPAPVATVEIAGAGAATAAHHLDAPALLNSESEQASEQALPKPEKRRDSSDMQRKAEAKPPPLAPKPSPRAYHHLMTEVDHPVPSAPPPVAPKPSPRACHHLMTEVDHPVPSAPPPVAPKPSLRAHHHLMTEVDHPVPSATSETPSLPPQEDPEDSGHETETSV